MSTTPIHFRARFAPVGPAGPPGSGVTVRIDGVSFGPFPLVSSPVRNIDLGHTGGNANRVHVKYDYVTVGTTGFGSSELFSDDFSAVGPVPPWDSVNDSGGAGSVTGGEMVIDTTGGFYYATRDWGSDEATVFAQFKVMFLTGCTAPVFMGDLFDATFTNFVSFQLKDGATSSLADASFAVFDASTTEVIDIGDPIVADQWYTVDVAIVP